MKEYQFASRFVNAPDAVALWINQQARDGWTVARLQVETMETRSGRHTSLFHVLLEREAVPK